jgi:hypothetical protein
MPAVIVTLSDNGGINSNQNRNVCYAVYKAPLQSTGSYLAKTGKQYPATKHG